jgi:muramoyltetrapeptide carboxypeptidase
MSDITALNLYFQQQWQWPTIHGALALDKFSPESIAKLKAILLGEVKEVSFVGKPLNALAKEPGQLLSSVTGGNLCVMQAGIGTSWQVDGRDKIILLEEIGERGYRVDRMLAHLTQADIFKQAKAILLGDFLGGTEPDGTSLIQSVLERFARECPVPVVQIEGVGHGYTNFAMPLGTPASLQLGNEIKLACGL